MVLDTDKLESDAAYREEMQHRFFSDHFFAAEIIGFTKFIKHLHQPAVDILFPWNPNLSIEDQDLCKYRMHIDPRHTFKSTLAIVDRVMAIAAFPKEMAVLVETATQPLGKQMVVETAKLFWNRPNRPKTLLHRIFPDHLLSKLPEGEWSTPQRGDIFGIDTSLAYTSPKSTQSGWHPWRIDADDMVETLNSGINADRKVRQGVIDTYNTNKNCLRLGGYLKLIGTRYHPFELYGKLLQTMNPNTWKVLIRGALTVRDGARLIPGEFPAEDEIILHFPELLPYSKLRDDFIDDYESFMCQMMNDPKGGSVPKFDDKAYEASQIAPEKIPAIGDTWVCWRLPYGGKESMATYAEGAAARIVKEKVYIIDCWRGIYSPSGLAEKIVKTMRQMEAEGLIMEAMPGTEYMAAHIRNEAQKKNLSIRILWEDFEEEDSRRAGRMEQMEPMIKGGRILFSTAATAAGEMRKQIVHYGLVLENGILDCVSQLAQRVPLSIIRANISEEEIEFQSRRREDAQWNQIFRQTGMPVVEDSIEQVAQAKATLLSMDRRNGGMPPLPGGLDG